VSEDRRAALVEAALQSLAERGLGAVSVRDVAARAGVSQGLIRHHFGSFSALLVEAYRQTTARVDALLTEAVEAAGPDPQARMQAFLAASFSDSIADRELLAAWLGFWGLVRSDPNAAAVHAETYAAYRARIEGLLGDLGVEDVRGGAIGLAAMLDGLWLELCLDPSTFDAAEAVRIAEAWVAGVTSGAKTRYTTV
jgi:AcrR family transcriptional regulator